MNGAIPPYATSNPCTAPHAAHTTSGNRTASHGPPAEPRAASTPPSAYSEPTDRSMPPVVMTKVIPSASSQTKALLPRIVLTSDHDASDGEATVAAAHTVTSTTSGP